MGDTPLWTLLSSRQDVSPAIFGKIEPLFINVHGIHAILESHPMPAIDCGWINMIQCAQESRHLVVILQCGLNATTVAYEDSFLLEIVQR